MDRRKQFDIAYMKMALAVAELSRAKRSKVGAIIVNPDDQVIAQGFNGTPSGFDNNCEYEYCSLKGQKYPDPVLCDYKNTQPHEDGSFTCDGCIFFELKTKNEVIHAEPNAIMKCARNGHSTNGATIYVTLSPCIDCAKLILQAGIRRVVYLEQYRNTEGLDFLKRGDIRVEQLKDFYTEQTN